MTNLYRNPGFAGLADWLKTSVDSSVARIEGQSHDWKAPNVTQDGAAVRVELSYGPFWTAFYQDMAVVVGAVYKITWTVKAEMAHPDSATRAGDPLSAEARIKVDTAVGEWTTGAALAYGVPVIISSMFTATAAAHRFGVEVRARHSLFQNRFTLSSPLLELVSSPTTPPGGGAPTDPLAVLTNLVTGLEAEVDLSERVNIMIRARMDAIKTEIVRLRND